MRTFGKVMIAVALLVSGCDDDDDDIIGPNGDFTTFDVTLTPSDVATPCLNAGSLATGTATVSIPDDDANIQVNNLTFSGLSGPATSATINAGTRGAIGPVVFPLNVTVTPFSTVAFDAADYPSPVPSGASPDFQSFVEAMRDGNTYINVATAACPDGEIRAQIQ